MPTDSSSAELTSTAASSANDAGPADEASAGSTASSKTRRRRRGGRGHRGRGRSKRAPATTTPVLAQEAAQDLDEQTDDATAGAAETAEAADIVAESPADKPGLEPTAPSSAIERTSQPIAEVAAEETVKPAPQRAVEARHRTSSRRRPPLESPLADVSALPPHTTPAMRLGARHLVARAGPGAVRHLGRRSFGGTTRTRQQFRPSGAPPVVGEQSLPTAATGESHLPAHGHPHSRHHVEAPGEANRPTTPRANTAGERLLTGPAKNEAADTAPPATGSLPEAILAMAQAGSEAAQIAAPAPPVRRSGPPRQLLINVADEDEVRIAVLQQGILDELYMERASTELHVGNIYKGRVTNVEPAIQAAFIDFGIGKNGFLHISDLHPQYFSGARRSVGPKRGPRGEADETPDSDDTDIESAAPGGIYGEGDLEFSEDAIEEFDMEAGPDHILPMEKVGRKTPRHSRPPIQQCLRRGQEIIVQVTKEGIGTKGPTLTSYISLPGRYLVMMPGMSQLGVSRKIEDETQRRALRKILQELDPPKNLGFIIRTAGIDRTKKELQQDLMYLVRMWRQIGQRITTQAAPTELYQESDLVIRTIRDLPIEDFDRIIVDDPQVALRVRDFLSIVNPAAGELVDEYTETLPLFQRFNVERQIEKINSRRVEMPNGGSLVIDSAEALVAIDVNSGRYREFRDAELTAYNINKDAIKEICRQLRLRDLGGVVVIDFIDMREDRHKREIERLLREEMKLDRARAKVLRMSQFCMVELTRQRVKPSLKRSIYQDCPHCRGAALIKTPESVTLDVMRRLAAGASRADVSRIDVRVYPTVATFILNRKRKQLVALEDRSGKRFNIYPDAALAGDAVLLEAFDIRGNLLNLGL
ncbi:MAG: Rne/Rng family ribonuclease [Phycisphaerales bacterium]|nr:Rne/Rng family ribonuclease [Phycisphaerales bacterium]